MLIGAGREYSGVEDSRVRAEQRRSCQGCGDSIGGGTVGEGTETENRSWEEKEV